MSPSPRIGQYKILQELGRGGMGVVYLAYDPAIARQVAIKTILIPETSDIRALSLREALIREARAAGGMTHPGIVTMFQMGVENEMVYVAMEFLPGGTLDQRLKPGTRSDRRWAIQIVHQIADALDYAHAAGFVHRDIKPGNILFADSSGNRVKVADFGLARAMSTTDSHGVVAGTPHYMSPEQISGEKLDGRSDQFALAVMTYEILTGCLAFDANEFPALLSQIRNAEPPPTSQMNPDLHPVVDQVIAKALSKTREKRYASCSEFAAALALASEGRSAPSQPPQAIPKKEPDPELTLPRWLVVISAAIVAVLLLAAMVYFGNGLFAG